MVIIFLVEYMKFLNTFYNNCINSQTLKTCSQQLNKVSLESDEWYISSYMTNKYSFLHLRSLKLFD